MKDIKNIRKQFLLTESAEIQLSTLSNQEVETIYALNLGKDGDHSLNKLEIENQQFFNLLFDQEDTVCVCNTPYKFEFYQKAQVNKELGRYVSINASNPATKTRRSEDVTSFRNFLVEFDDMSLTTQLEKMDAIGFPYSAVTFSGNKSLHFIISLENPVSSIKEYQLVSNWLHNIINKYVGKADPSTKPPSFTTRYPNIINENGIYSQKLLILNKRVSDDIFFNWLAKHQDLKPSPDMFKQSFREKINSAVDFYITDILKTDFEKGEWFDCPLCVEEGNVSNTKRMKVNKSTKSIKCHCSKDHDQNIVKKLFQIQRENGGRNE